MKDAQFVWSHRLADGTEDTCIATLEEQDLFTKPASSIASATVPNFGVPKV